jgi:hypothetical protein
MPVIALDAIKEVMIASISRLVIAVDKKCMKRYLLNLQQFEHSRFEIMENYFRSAFCIYGHRRGTLLLLTFLRG